MPYPSVPTLDLVSAADCLAAGGVVVFPTETYYALGCMACKGQAVERIYAAKGRHSGKPLPLLAGSWEQALATMRLDAAATCLARHFWPGPLTLLGEPCSALPAALMNDEGRIALRVSSHALAAGLARMAGGALTASSANLAGHEPATDVEHIDPALLEHLAEMATQGLPTGILPAHPADQQPQGGPPSTLAACSHDDGGWQAHILRQGAIGRDELLAVLNGMA